MILQIKNMPLYLHSDLRKQPDSVAQLEEHLPFKERVLGSSPSRITKKPIAKAVGFFYWVDFIL